MLRLIPTVSRAQHWCIIISSMLTLACSKFNSEFDILEFCSFRKLAVEEVSSVNILTLFQICKFTMLKHLLSQIIYCNWFEHLVNGTVFRCTMCMCMYHCVLPTTLPTTLSNLVLFLCGVTYWTQQPLISCRI